ncbi:MAG: 5-(carboxyamino)imidazole ribonucleotide mutase [Fusobacteriaceae bacterium]
MNIDISVIMGSNSDLPTMKLAIDILKEFEIGYEVKIISAHRTPEEMFHFAKNAESRGIKIIIAGAGGAAHLPGMVASLTTLPVIGVPIKSKNLNGIDSLLSIVQMPGGVPVATVAIGEAGAKNSALLAISILGIYNSEIREKLQVYKENMKNSVIQNSEVVI